MDPNVTSPHSEPDQDNSSLQNPSTNPAEAGTTEETRDEDHETSSIEALNWSEVEEEELAAAQQAEAAAAAAAALGIEKSALTSETKVDSGKKENDADDDDNTDKMVTSSTTGSSTVLVNEDRNVLSTSLLQSINSTVGDEDPQARKLSVIENWAEEVTNAVERGEMEMTEDFPDEDGVTGDDENEGEEDNEEGVRRRRGKKLTPDMVSSVISSTGESIVDPLSNAPVLDDGPIWDKGPRTYTFQENRRINQKLTFCVLIAVVLAIGLGLGNLVAHQECEAEFKSTQKSQSLPPNTKPVERSPVPESIPTTTPSPIIPDRSTDSSMMGSKLPTKQRYPSIETIDMDDDEDDSFGEDGGYKEPPQKETIRKRDEPIIDPKYKMHAETVSNVVHTLDRLSKKIDQFENTTRRLQGVLMIPDEETPKEDSTTESSSLYDEQVHRDDEELESTADDFLVDEDAIPPMTDVEDLIDAIEQTPNYLELKREEDKLEKLQKERDDEPHSNLFDLDKILPKEINREWKKMMKSFEKYREFERRFIKNERKRLKDEGKYDRFKWRVPEQYTDEEKKALNNKFKSTWIEYIKLTNKDSPNPLDEVFGVEEEIEERTYGDVFHYPWPDPEAGLTEEEERDQFAKNLEDLNMWEKENKHLLADDEGKTDIPDLTIEEVFPDTSGDSAHESSLDDDLIVLGEVIEKQDDKIIRLGSQPPAQEDDSDSKDINGKFTDQSGKHVSEDSSSLEPEGSQSSSTIVLSTPNINNVSKDPASTESPREESAKVKREAFKQSSKPKKTGQKSGTIKAGSDMVDQNKKVRNVKGGEKKQKEQKSSKSGKQRGKMESVNAEGTPAKNSKSSGKGKKVKNLESNKVFENVKGKNNEKRRVPPSSSSEGTSTGRDPSSNRNSKKAQRESTNTGRSNERQRSAKQKPNTSNNQPQQQQGKLNNRNNQPRYHDPNNKENQQQQQRPQHGNREKREASYENGKPPSQLKYDSQDFSSKETQHRQQKQEFNTNRYNGKSNTGNRKSKNWESKEKAGRPRERTSSWEMELSGRESK